MAKEETKEFLPLGVEPLDIDEVVSRTVEQRNIPTLQRPSDVAVVTAPKPGAPVRATKVEVRSDRQDVGEEPEAFRVLCKGYVKQQLEERRQEMHRKGKKVTLSYLVLKALRADGIVIHDEDFQEDGRRLRGQKPT